MKKLLFIIFILFSLPVFVRAQGKTLGKTKEQIRSMINSDAQTALLRGVNSDTITTSSGTRLTLYYKNNICYSSKSIFPIKYMNRVTQSMTADSYKKVADNLWINSNRKTKAKITVLDDKNYFSLEATLMEN